MPDAILDGNYRARAVTGRLEKSRVKGSDQYRVEFQVAEGPYKGQRVTWYGYLGERSAERTIASLRLCGCTFPFDNPANLDGLTRNIVSIEVVTQMRHDGTGTYTSVRWVNADAPSRLQTLSEAIDVESKLRGLIAKSKPQTETPPPGAGAAFDAADPEDDGRDPDHHS